MARGALTHFAGSLPAAGSVSAQADALYAALETQINAYQSNATDAWETLQVITAAASTRDLVFRSVGDRTLASGAGDTRLFLRMTRSGSNAIQLLGYQDWSTTDTAGAHQTFLNQISISTVDPVDYWTTYNEYEFHIVVNQGSGWTFAGFGNPDRAFTPASVAGAAFTTAALSPGSNVTVNVDRDLTSTMRANTPVLIINQTASGSSLESEAIELATITNVTATQVTFSSIASAHPSGSLFGVDPACNVVWAVLNNGDPTLAITHAAAGFNPGGSSSQAALEIPILSRPESVFDPAATGLYLAAYATTFDNITGAPASNDPRGIFRGISYWANDTQATASDVNFDLNTATNWLPFPTLQNNLYTLNLFQS